MAMGPRIDAHLKLVDGGRTVKVVGPTGDWDRYAVSATFKVVVAQIQEDRIVFATGIRMSRTPRPTPGGMPTRWCTAIPTSSWSRAPATAWAIASVKTRDDQYEPYAWSVETRLLDAPSPDPPNYPWP